MRAVLFGILLVICVSFVPFAKADVPTVAFVGVAHIHTPEFIGIIKKRAGEVKVAGVWDHDAARAAKRAKELGVPVIDDVAKIWSDPVITAVIICSETNQHKDLIAAATKAHKAVYAEKPLGMTAPDAYEMAHLIDETGLPFTTGYFMRSDPKLLFLKKQIEAGNFGTITRIRSVNAHNGALGGWFDGEWRWMADPKQAGVGGFGDMGAHSLDVMLWLVGQPVDRVTATLSTGTARYADCDEYGEGQIVFHNGTIATLAAGWDDVANPVTLEICGTQGHATIVSDKLYFKSGKIKGSSDRNPVPAADLPQRLTIPMERWIDVLNGKKDVPLITADEAAYETAVMDAMYDAAKSHIWVEPVQPKK